LYGTQTNGVNSEVNISVSGCTFRDPKAGATAVRYNNGSNTVGTGTVCVSSSTFTGYGRGVQVEQNGDDAVNTTVAGCTFSKMSLRPLELNGGRQASVTGCTFNDFAAGQHNGAVMIFDTYSATGQTQTVTLTGNTFTYGDTADIYPVLIGAGTKINEGLGADAGNTFGADYPEAYRYIALTCGVGYLERHRSAVWGDAGIPYLLTGELVITGTDESNQSSLAIEPGVTVCLGDGTGADNLSVRGTLTAEGTADKPITFTKKTGVTYGGEIYAGSNLKGSIVLKHCVMDGLFRGINITTPGDTGSRVLLENCTVRNTQHPMILAGRTVLAKNCTITGKGLQAGGGQYVDSIAIEGCSITASGEGSGDGVNITNTKSVTLKNCLIAGFSNCGIAIVNNNYQTLAAGAPLIENCTVASNGYGVVFARDSSSDYGAFIRNSIVAGNTGLDLANQVYESGGFTEYADFESGSIAYSLIGDDGNALPFSLNDYEHPSLGKIRRIAAESYSGRVVGDPLFADAANGDCHVKSAAGRWDGSTWVMDAVTSPCIDAGDPASAYANEPAPNGGRVNLGGYGNTAEASKSGAPFAQYSISVSASPTAGGTVSGGGSYGADASVTVTAAPSGSYRFVKWTEDGTQVSANANYTFYATANRTLAAVFESIPPHSPSIPPVTPPAPVAEVSSGEHVTAVTVERLIADGESLTVAGEDGAKLIFDTEALKGIREQVSGSVKVKITDVSDEYQQTHPGNLVFSLTVNSGDKVIADFGGSVTVSLPYELRAGEAADNVAVWHLTENGAMVEIPCTYDAVTGLASFTVSHFSLYMLGIASPWDNPFTDVAVNDWYVNAVMWAYENGLMVGTAHNLFSPQTGITRGMIVTILHRLEKAPASEAASPFPDVEAGKWYTDAIAWAAENGIASGYGNGKFGPNDNVTREQVAAILYRYASFKGYDVSKTGDLTKFGDAGKLSAWAESAMSWGTANGLINGMGGGVLDPAGNATRTEVAAILHRFMLLFS
ncbi:MAG: hypothetical protein GXX99_03005, partial [Clostridiales bacterium]|nr:hypothetical protein [Clostridiales bacterium]